MKNQELERKILEIITNIRETKVQVRPEKEWLLDKYERYKQRLEEEENQRLTRTQTDERLYKELYHTAPLKYSQITKIRYWRSGSHFPGKYEEALEFAQALGLDEEEIRYFFQVYLEQNYFADEKKRKAAAELLDSLKTEFQQKIHPSELLKYGIRESDLPRCFRVLYFEKAAGYVNLTSVTKEGRLNPQESASFGSELMRIQKMQGSFSRKTLIRHLIVLGSPFVSVEQMNIWLEVLGCAPLQESHTTVSGYSQDLLLIKILKLYEKTAGGLEPQKGRLLLCCILAEVDRTLRKQGMQELCFMYFKALRGCRDGK
mgnify:FL=1